MQISKTRNIIGWVLSALPCAMILFSGSQKIMKAEWMLENMSKVNMLEITPYIGVLEIFCVIIYLLPKTSNIGFFLLCSYIGGIIASETAMGMTPFLGIALAVLLYIGTMLRKPALSGLGI